MDSKLIIIGFALIGLSLFGVGIASAESGTLSISGTGHDNSFTQDGTGASSAGLNWTTFRYVQSGTYNHINYINISMGGSVNYPAMSDFTTFTIISGGTGQGIVSYSASLDKITWTFTDDSRITAKDFQLSYGTTNFFTNFTFTGNGQVVYGNMDPDTMTTHWTCLKTLDFNPGGGRCFQGRQSGNAVIYGTNAGSNTNIGYVVTYPLLNTFNINITRASETVNTKLTVHSSLNNSLTYQIESSFNHNNTNIFGTYTDGLWLRADTSAGDYSDVLINATGIIATNITIGGQGGSPSGQIYFDYSTAALTYSYGVNVSLVVANWSNTFSPNMRIRVRDPLGNTISGYPIDFSSQFYNTSRLWVFQRTGTYNASLYMCSYFDVGCKALVALGTFDGNLIDVATLTVSQTPYVYSITTDANSYTTGDIIRFVVSNPSPSTTYFNMFLQIGGQNLIIDRQIPANTTSYINWTVTGDMQFGTWESDLNTGLNGVGRVASKTFSIGNPLPGTRVSVRWDSNNGLGLTNNLYYTSNQNTSTVNIYKTLPGNNASSLIDTFQALSTDSQPKPYLMDVIGVWTATITDNGNSSNKSIANVTVVSNAATECNKNLPDYACWDKSSYVRGDVFVINYKATSLPLFAFTLNVRLLVFDPDGILVLNKSIIASPPDITWTTPTVGIFSKSFSNSAKFGKWHVILMRDGNLLNSYTDGSQIADSYAVVVNTNKTIIVPNPGGSGVNTCKFWDGWVSNFGIGVDDSTRFLFALLIIGLITGIITGATKNFGIGVSIGFFPYAYFLFLSLSTPCGTYMPTWTAAFIALIVVAKLRWF